MLRAEPSTLSGKLSKPFRVNAFGGRRVELKRPQQLDLLDEPRQRSMPNDTRREPGPGELAEIGAVTQVQELVRGSELLAREASGQLLGHMAVGLQQRGADQPLDDRFARCRNPSTAQFLKQSPGDSETARRGERDRRQPCLHLSIMRLGEGRIAELAAQGFQLLVPRGAARTVRGKIVEIEVELDSNSRSLRG
jgi:hypothetical protein